MKHITCRTYKSFTFGSSEKLTEIQLEKLMECFGVATRPLEGGLEGRTSVTRIHLEGIGPVVVKHYIRGGFIGRFNKHFYLNLGKSRPGIEYEQLLRAKDAGINVPEPVCFASRGMLFYRAWLVTRAIERPRSLAQLGMKDLTSAVSVVKTLIPQFKRLLDSRIYHKDLHPGNVLIDKKNKIFIIDFDKAGVFRGDKKTLLDRYLKRWERAVTKYGLPEEIHSTLHKELIK